MNPTQTPSTQAHTAEAAAETVTSHKLAVLSFPLWGSRLIEASAGTGKTWTIAALYVRLVLGHGQAQSGVESTTEGPPQGSPLGPLMPQDILVMTFTRAATRELSDRIRARLTEAAAVFRGLQTTTDSFLTDLVRDYPPGPEREKAAYRLALAAQSMDDAAVYTIDAWCQRMLREHAFDSGNLFEENLVADEAALRLEAVQDYWRESLYPLPAQQVGQVLGIWGDVHALEKDMKLLLAAEGLPTVQPGQTLADVLTDHTLQCDKVLADLKRGWPEQADALRDWLDDTLAQEGSGWNKRKFGKNHYTKWLEALKLWAQGAGDAAALQKAMGKSGWERFTPQGMAVCRADGAVDGYALPPQCQAFADLQAGLQKLPQLKVALRTHARTRVAERLAWLKQRNAQFGFADMLQRLESALMRVDESGVAVGEQIAVAVESGDVAPMLGNRLARRLRAQFPVALIDEFQDTSPLQFRIFNHIYRAADNLPDAALLLIGDPKQSIYGFRGADILSYLQARGATKGRHYVLDTNFRSTQSVVDVVNRWFQVGDERSKQGAFGYAQDNGDNPLPFVAVGAKGRDEVLLAKSLVQAERQAVPAMTLVHRPQLSSVRDAVVHMSALCAEQIVAWLGDSQATFVRPGKADERLKPKDIAVLVRTGKEADAVRQALRERGVASVYLSDRDSVFDSDEAGDLCLWLRAVAEPKDMRRVRAALATRTVGLSLTELHQMTQQGHVLDDYADHLHLLRQTWQTQGVLAMVRQSLHTLQLAARWRGQHEGERRLTNVLHLAELLQSASMRLDGEQALIRWLVQQMDEDGEGEEQTVRLESDEDLVKVVTIHASKGLEYPVVCLPFAHSHRVVTAYKTSLLSLTDDQGLRQNLLQFDAQDAERADEDRLREDLRLWYVALTRACHALWVGWASVKKGTGHTCQNHLSAAGRLLGGGVQFKENEWAGLLQALLHGQKSTPLPVQLDTVMPTQKQTWLERQDERPALHEALVCTASFDKNWTIASFSRLARDLSSQPVLHTAVTSASNMALSMAMPRPADDEPTDDSEVLGQRLSLSGMSVKGTAVAAWHTFARGPSAGNFLHDQLEWLAAEGFALQAGTAQADRLAKRCERAGYKAQAPEVLTWLSRVVLQPLRGPDVALNALKNVLPEMEFWLPADRLHAKDVDQLCRQYLLPGVSRPKLPDAQLHGMLMGFADLVFEHQGRYWVLDYKSNHLGPDDAAYTEEALGKAMAHHRYEVQAALYMLALHRLLRARLGAGYRPSEHLGGAVYLFLRGIDGPAAGCCTLPAPVALMDGLDAMLGQRSTSVQDKRGGV